MEEKNLKPGFSWFFHY